MVGKTQPITAADRKRFEAIKSMPCVACQIRGLRGVCGATEAHHLLSGNRRIGHEATIPLGSWHHRGVRFPGWSIAKMEAAFGPSLALSSKRFRGEFGSDDELLARVNERIQEAA